MREEDGGCIERSWEHSRIGMGSTLCSGRSRHLFSIPDYLPLAVAMTMSTGGQLLDLYHS